MILDELKAKQIIYAKSGESFRLGVLRYFLAQVKNREIEMRPEKQELTDEIVFKVLRKQIKDRRDGVDMYKKANRPESVEKELKELGVLEEFAKEFPFDLNLPPFQA